MREIFAESALDLDTYPDYADVDEDGLNYVENAMLKARALHRQLRDAGIEAAVLADDSGLEVDALDGRPGVLSARYAGINTSWPQRRNALLKELEGVAPPRRRARFVCVIALVLPNGEPLVGVGQVEGEISTQEVGLKGFGYDPIFFYAPLNRTFAELSAEEKNSVSHRSAAAEVVLERLQSHA